MKNLKPLIVGVGAGLIAYCLIFSLFHPFAVSGPSMEPTFYDENLVITKEYDGVAPRRGDVVIAVMGGKRVIKRVVALPGDAVGVRDGLLYVNGEISEYNFELINEPGLLSEETTLHDDEYVLLGDNRNNSIDSRDNGPVSQKDILYKVKRKIF
ncbi:MAG: signal peptidase I [Butyrivibrio sp.]|uniref:signal peptidase I n=1 Tax=Butyrivibrio sp. TaxID=28121 RepID=UPI001B723965|nr:signal peptidase I [Butyrivibrio sp.]MBP3781723.1 signal peptidase I [Butyrivibrio sp.]